MVKDAVVIEPLNVMYMRSPVSIHAHGGGGSMIIRLSRWILILMLVLGSIPLFCYTEKSVYYSPLGFDESGVPILAIDLYSVIHPGKKKTFRFVLSTGTYFNVIDKEISKDFVWDEHYSKEIINSSGDKSVVPLVAIKRIGLAGVIRDEVPALVLDLKNSIIGRTQDYPIDGILGMEFFRMKRFVLNPQNKRIEWWQKPFANGIALPIHYQADGAPYVTIRLGAKSAACVLDTGSNGGIDLPKSFSAGCGLEPDVSASSIGSDPEADFIGKVPRVDADGGAWIYPYVAFRDNATTGIIGEDVLLQSMIYFDFIENRVIFTPRQDGSLPIRSEITRNIPIVWDRSERLNPKLIVFVVKNGSLLKRNGFMVGDQIVQIDDIKGDKLSLSFIKIALNDNRTHKWVIVRQGKNIQIVTQ